MVTRPTAAPGARAGQPAPWARAGASAWRAAAGLLLCGLVSASAAAAPASGPQATPIAAPAAAPSTPRGAADDTADGARLDALLLLVEESPGQARAGLSEATAAAGTTAGTTSPARRRSAALLQAWVATRLGEPDALAPGALIELAAAGAMLAPGLAAADTALLQSLKAERDGRLAVEGLAQQALAGYAAYCSALAPLRADCEFRTRWQMRQLLAQHATGQHSAGAAREHAEAAMALAAAGLDKRRQAWSESQLALALADTGDQAGAASHLAHARTLVGRRADTTLQLRLAYTEAALAW